VGLAIILVLVIAPGALAEKVALVSGAKIIAKRRHFFPAILKVRSDSHNHAEKEGEGAHDQQDKRKVGHGVLLCKDCLRPLEWRSHTAGPNDNCDAGWGGRAGQNCSFWRNVGPYRKRFGLEIAAAHFPGMQDVSDGRPWRWALLWSKITLFANKLGPRQNLVKHSKQEVKY
jgi:hypothetical protein